MQPNRLISELSGISEKYPRVEKVLIVPGYAAGHQILEYLARAGINWVNFRAATAAGLAAGVIEQELTAGNLEVLSNTELLTIVDDIFNSLTDSGKLKYFERHPINKGMVEAMMETLKELRLCGITSGDLKPNSFLNESKGKDIQTILSEYEHIIKEKSLVDDAGLIMMALKHRGKINDTTERKFIVCSHHFLRGIEREFLEQLAGDNLITAGEDSVFGLKAPADIYGDGKADTKPECTSDVDRLKWLFDSGNAPRPFKDGTIEIFSAVGCRNEVYEVMRRILAGNLKIDEAEIVCTELAGYRDIIYSLCERLDIPVTFASGIPWYLTNAGRIVTGFLMWIKENFSEIYMRRMFESVGLKCGDSPEGNNPVPSNLGFLLRTAGVGWGRERYPLILGKRIEECKKNVKEAQDEGDEDKAARQDTKAKDLAILKQVCEELIALVPIVDKEKKIDFKMLCEGCIKFMRNYVKTLSERDGEFVKTAAANLEMLSGFAAGKIHFDEAMEKLIQAVSKINVEPSRPKPGHLHVSHYGHGGKSGRQNTFILGLDESRFPGKGIQDPILLDEERQNIGKGLELSGARLTKNIYTMAGLLSGLRGKVTVSYSSYDIKEDRKSFPSSLVLQVFRLKEGKPDADYRELFKSICDVGFNGNPDIKACVDETDWWLRKLVPGDALKDAGEFLKKHYPGIKEGAAAAESRESIILTEYDGKVETLPKELDPRENKDMVMSCSRLESAAKCPFAYFLENVLKIRKPDEREKDPGSWLDPSERGSLLHEVYQEVGKYIIDKKWPGDRKDREKLVEDILNAVIKQYKEEIPPPGDVIFENECAQLRRDMKVFLHMNDQLGTEPVQCEIVFGEKKENAARIPVGEGKNIILRGRMDRIDKTGESEYHVWDYKTGSASSFEENEYVKGGQQLQHSLYAVAAQELLKKKDKNARVTKSGYLLPTEKGTKDGKGGMFVRAPREKEKWQGALNKLLDLIASGTFIANKKAMCDWCDYIDVCGGKAAQQQINTKLQNASNEALNTWKELQKYE